MATHPISTPTTPPEWAPGRRARLNKTIAYYSAFISLGLAAAYLGPTLPGLADNVHSTIQQISSLFVFSSFGYMLGSLLGGFVYDRWSGHPVLIVVLFTMIAAMFTIPLVPLLSLLGVVLFVQGLALGMLDVGINTLLVWVHRDEMGPFMNGLHFFFGVGAVLSPLIIGQALAISKNITWPFWILGVIMLPAVVMLARQPSPTHMEKAEPALVRPAIPLLIILLALFDFCYVGAEVAYGGWIFTYAVKLNLAPETMAAFLTSGFWGAFTVGRLFSIPLATRFSARSILFVDLLVTLAGLALIQILPGSFVALWIGTVAVGLGMASIFPTVIRLAESTMTMTGFVTSWLFVGSGLGGMLLPWLIGQYFERVGAFVTMLAVTIFTLLNLALLFGILWYTKKPNKL